ncbi:DUF1207 domain-containing protein [Bacteroidota bacterium]
MIKNLTIALILVFSLNLYSQRTKEWFPAEFNIQPFTSNLLEPRNEFMFALGEDWLRLDIGTSRDILQLKSGEETISLGADLFTFTRLRSNDNFKFPVETIDFFFGINAGYNKNDGDREYGFRIRFSHLSAHLVDGRYDVHSDKWVNGRDPFTFSKEFIELFPYYRISGFRIYLGLTYIFHIIPEIINKGIYQVGFDYYILPFSNGSITPFVAYDFKLNAINNTYFGNNIAKLGVKFGSPLSRGFSILISYVSGKSIHGELFDLTENYFNIGFNLDL